MRIIVLGLAVLALLPCTPAAATTFVMMSDEDLVDRAPSVVEAVVISRDSSPAPGMPATDYLVEVDRVLKGNVPGSTLVVRVPGGVRSDGVGLKIYGAPELAVGDRAVLFLSPAGDGTFRIFHLMLGAFQEIGFRGQRLAVRNLGQTREVALPGQETEARRRARLPRRLEGFTSWIAARAQGEIREPDYFLPDAPEELRAQVGRFTLTRSRVGNKIRWFEFDEGGTIDWRFHSDGQPGLSTQELQTALQQGIAAWNGIPRTNIRYRLKGATTATGGLTNNDGVNAVVFNDPNNNDTFGGAFSCIGGGVLAISGPWFSIPFTSGYRGETHHRTAEADLVTNRGLECWFSRPDRLVAASELFGHELGHTLGISHSCADDESGSCDTAAKDDALMRAFVHDDGRGARLNDDDRGAARALYASSAIATPPAAPSNLQANTLSSTAVELTWTDNANDEGSFQVELRRGDGPFMLVVDFLARNTEATTLTGLRPGTGYTFRVRARNSAGFSAYSNLATATTQPSIPQAPGNLRAAPVSPTQVLLAWQDNSDNEDNFRIEMTSPTMAVVPGEDPFVAAGVAGPGVEQFTISGLQPDTPYTFRVRAINGAGASPYSNLASATTRSLGGVEPCVRDEETLCLLERRFRVRVQWRNPRPPGGQGAGQAVRLPGSDLTGMFWFFDAFNIELIVKMLDATSINGFYWTFYGALSDVEYWISVVDTETEETVTYYNPAEEICGLGDVRSFPRLDDPVPAPQGAAATAGETGGLGTFPASGLAGIPAAGTTEPSCEPGPTSLCLLGNRFQVEVVWSDPRTFDSGTGTVVDVPAVPSDATGFFWFFAPDNVELVVKMLDGRALNGFFWFFWGALTDVEYTLIVTDTVTGATRTYINPAFNICGGADVRAFD